MSGWFVGVAVDWARPGAAGSTESVHPLPACFLAPRYLPRWVLEHSTTLENSLPVIISVTKVIPALTPDRHVIPASCSHSISHSWKENPSRVSGTSSRLSVLGGRRGVTEQPPGQRSHVFYCRGCGPPTLPASWHCLHHSSSFCDSPKASPPAPSTLALLLWGWPVFANSHGKF